MCIRSNAHKRSKLALVCTNQDGRIYFLPHSLQICINILVQGGLPFKMPIPQFSPCKFSLLYETQFHRFLSHNNDPLLDLFNILSSLICYLNNFLQDLRINKSRIESCLLHEVAIIIKVSYGSILCPAALTPKFIRWMHNPQEMVSR